MTVTAPSGSRTHTHHYVLDALEEAGLGRKPADWSERLEAVTADMVRAVLARPPQFSLGRFLTLASPAAGRMLEELAVPAQRLTRQRFGNAISLFAPLYVSNFCVNRCRYCGFNAGHPHRRRRLSLDEAMDEARVIAAEGFRDILLVSGEDREHIDVGYLADLAGRLRRDNLFATVGMESYILKENDYRQLADAGIDGVTIFQETYEPATYATWHPAGPKAVHADRIAASEAAAAAGMRRLGLGVLLGLEDWRYDALAMAVHADTVARRYWRVRTSFSFPRIRPSESGHVGDFPCLVSDRDLTQMLLALRLCFPDSGMTLSTRELPALRDNLIPLAVTQISAGSKTNPGGYAESGRGAAATATEQFAVSDERSAGEMATVLRRLGFDPVWKDWDAAFSDEALIAIPPATEGLHNGD